MHIYIYKYILSYPSDNRRTDLLGSSFWWGVNNYGHHDAVQTNCL